MFFPLSSYWMKTYISGKAKKKLCVCGYMLLGLVGRIFLLFFSFSVYVKCVWHTETKSSQISIHWSHLTKKLNHLDRIKCHRRCKFFYMCIYVYQTCKEPYIYDIYMTLSYIFADGVWGWEFEVCIYIYIMTVYSVLINIVLIVHRKLFNYYLITCIWNLVRLLRWSSLQKQLTTEGPWLFCLTGFLIASALVYRMQPRWSVFN